MSNASDQSGNLRDRLPIRIRARYQDWPLYRSVFVRTAHGWVLDAVNMKLRWTRGDRAIMRTAIQRVRGA